MSLTSEELNFLWFSLCLMPQFFHFVLLGKVEVRSTGMILTLVTHLLIPNVTSAEANPNFQYLCDLC